MHSIFNEIAEYGSFNLSRYSLAVPFVQNGYLYATDGRVCVRAKTTEVDSKDRLLPVMDKLGWDLTLYKSEACDPPSYILETPLLIPCSACKGTGECDKITCPECDGDKAIECSECGQDRDCPKCDGEGIIGGVGKCPDCDGRKRELAHKYEYVWIETFKMTEPYAWILKRHNAKVYLPLDTAAHLMRFTIGDDIEGLLAGAN